MSVANPHAEATECVAESIAAPAASSPRTRSRESSWLIRDGMDRERMLDMDRRIAPARATTLGVLALALIACGPWLGWWTLAPLALAGLLFSVADTRLTRMRRPEYLMFGAWLGSEIVIAVAVAITGGPKVATISWLAIPIVTLASRFSDRGIAVGVTATLILLLALAFGVSAHAVLQNPTLVIAPAAFIVSVTLFSRALMRSDVEYRNRAVIDELTGMLNRSALVARVSELTQLSQLTGETVGLIICDIDRFKAINDRFGHARGDESLRELAGLIRKRLRAYDLAYRLGGEEFVILLPGASLSDAAAIAESLRLAVVQADPIDGEIKLTISCGVAASPRDRVLDYPALFSAADAALYEAKRSGRNCVRSAPAR